MLFSDDLRCNSKLWEERKRRVRSKMRFTFDRFAQISLKTVLDLTRRTRNHWSIAGRTAKPNQRVSSISRLLPPNSATDSILAVQTRKQSGMPELPLEIIHRIITISLPRPLDNYSARRRFLLPLCSLHSCLRRFAQRLLFARPLFYGPDSVALFLDTVEGNRSDFDFGGCVKSLKMVGPWAEASEADADQLFSRLLDSCDAIEEIWIDSLENVNFAQFARLRSEQPPNNQVNFADNA